MRFQACNVTKTSDEGPWYAAGLVVVTQHRISDQETNISIRKVSCFRDSTQDVERYLFRIFPDCYTRHVRSRCGPIRTGPE